MVGVWAREDRGGGGNTESHRENSESHHTQQGEEEVGRKGDGERAKTEREGEQGGRWSCEDEKRRAPSSPLDCGLHDVVGSHFCRQQPDVISQTADTLSQTNRQDAVSAG